VRNTLVFALAVAAVTAVLGVAVAQLLTRPLARLTQAAQRIAQGDLTASVSVRSGDEIGVLAATFNRMALRLQKTLQGLRESEEQYRGIYENAVEGIYRTSPEGRLLHANPAMAHMLGYDSSREILERLTDIRHQLYVNPTDRDRFLHRLHEEGDVHDFEVQFRRKDGSLMWGALHARLVRDDQGQVLYIEGLLNDVTRRKEAEQQLAELNHRLERMVDERTADLADKARELERANRRLLEMDELKSAFLSSVSHELRTPLTSVLGFAKLIRKDFARSFLPGEDAPPGMRKKSGRILDNLRVIEQEGERLTRMINDFLDLSKIESGRVDWHDTDVDPAAVVQHVTRAVQGQFSQKPQVRLRVRVAENLPVLHMDPDRLEQVLLNLLGNASKFTDQGHVDLDVAPHDGAVRFQVTDTGPGIPEHDLERIFDKFHQVRKSDTVSEKPVGTGLGLAICRQIVEHYGGSIHVFSELGKGSVFTVDLPAAETRAAHSRTMPHPRRHMAPHERTRPLLLVVDDDLPTCAFLTQLLEQEGYEVAAAYDGESALEAAHDLAPDLVTMDLLMPGMDGRVTIQRMREDQYLAHIPILVISVLRDADRAGGDAALRKPVDEHALLDTVHALLGQRAGTRDILVLQAEPADVEALNSLTTRRVRHLDESELWEQVGAGFHGTVIVPGHLEQDLDLARLSSAQGVQVLILPKTALEYLRRS
jgi:PAS domain S-box-containing protein